MKGTSASRPLKRETKARSQLARALRRMTAVALAYVVFAQLVFMASGMAAMAAAAHDGTERTLSNAVMVLCEPSRLYGLEATGSADDDAGTASGHLTYCCGLCAVQHGGFPVPEAATVLPAQPDSHHLMPRLWLAERVHEGVSRLAPEARGPPAL